MRCDEIRFHRRPTTLIVAPAAGEFNGDSQLDLAVTDLGSNEVALWLGRGDRRNPAKAAGVTLIPAWLPVSAPVASRAVSDWSPAVLSVAVKVWTPASAAVKV